MEEHDDDPICPYCTAEFCNQFALMHHVRECQAIIGKTEPEED
jgi:hypothetical protein